MLRICTVHVTHLYSACYASVQCMLRIMYSACYASVQCMLRICTVHVTHLYSACYASCTVHVTHLYSACYASVQCMLRICTVHVTHLSMLIIPEPHHYFVLCHCGSSPRYRKRRYGATPRTRQILQQHM